jgi:xanthine dehydrogenase molybdopterin-binding subunit B
VWLAIRDAVASVTGGAPRLDAPATPEAILRALGGCGDAAQPQALETPT